MSPRVTIPQWTKTPRIKTPCSPGRDGYEIRLVHHTGKQYDFPQTPSQRSRT
ncbi:hypothetical protein ET418_03960 [Oryzomonas rubra]|uniref:Uncharacterized protein n=1 Tax=Oryzomonas rubra TaxID=2509454 RepID=A0A5A9XMH5_9BACT|nr:hypothetical protein ET418_03960 [Oryzomonas rubra]